MTFKNFRWYAICDRHKKKIEEESIPGKFSPLDTEDHERCEWNRALKKNRCKDVGKFEFMPK